MRYAFLRYRAVEFVLTPTAIGRRSRGEPTWDRLLRLGSLRRVEAHADFRWDTPFKTATLTLTTNQHESVTVGPIKEPVRWVEAILDASDAIGAPASAHLFVPGRFNEHVYPTQRMDRRHA